MFKGLRSSPKNKVCSIHQSKSSSFKLSKTTQNVDVEFIQAKTTEDAVFYILNINESTAETCPGYLIKNNVKYEFFLIIRYTEDIVSKLNELHMLYESSKHIHHDVVTSVSLYRDCSYHAVTGEFSNGTGWTLYPLLSTLFA